MIASKTAPPVWETDKIQRRLNTLFNQICVLKTQIANVSKNEVASFTLDANGTYDMAAGDIIMGIVVDATTSFTLNIGSTPGGSDLISNAAIVGGTPDSITVMIYAKVARTLYISGPVPTATFIIVKNKL